MWLFYQQRLKLGVSRNSRYPDPDLVQLGSGLGPKKGSGSNYGYNFVGPDT